MTMYSDTAIPKIQPSGQIFFRGLEYSAVNQQLHIPTNCVWSYMLTACSRMFMLGIICPRITCTWHWCCREGRLLVFWKSNMLVFYRMRWQPCFCSVIGQMNQWINFYWISIPFYLLLLLIIIIYYDTQYTIDNCSPDKHGST